MMDANSPNAKYLAGGSALVAVLFAPGIVADGRASILALLVTGGAYVATFYFAGRAFTTSIVRRPWYRRLLGIFVAATGVMVWTYAQFVFGIDLLAPDPLSQVLLLAMVVLVLGGLAHVAFETGRLAESVAIRRTRVGSGEGT